MAKWLDVFKLRCGFRQLPGADLSHADLRGLDLRGINLEGANLEGARLGAGVTPTDEGEDHAQVD